MPRVNAYDVKGIFPDVDLTTVQINNFINTANIVVNNNLADESSLDEATLKEIEKWLAAHFCAISDMRASNEKVSSVGVGYQYKVDLNFQVTMYGQQACMLDHTGTLLALSKSGGKKKSQIVFIGDDLSDELQEVN